MKTAALVGYQKQRSTLDCTVVDLRISTEDYQQLYAGVVKEVFVTARDGKRIKFPARILRPYVRYDGVQGSFVIYFDREQRFQSIERL